MLIELIIIVVRVGIFLTGAGLIALSGSSFWQAAVGASDGNGNFDKSIGERAAQLCFGVIRLVLGVAVISQTTIHLG